MTATPAPTPPARSNGATSALGAQILKDLGIFVDPAARLQQPHLCRLGRLRHRDRRYRRAGRLTLCFNGDGLFSVRASCHHPLGQESGKETGHGTASSFWCDRRRLCRRGLYDRSSGRAASALRRPLARRHPRRCRTGARRRRLLFDGPGRAGAAARRLYPGADLARISVGAARRRQRQDRRHLFRMGRRERPENRDAVAADRRPGIGRRGRRRDRARAVPARLAHLDFRRAAIRQAAVRQ